MSVAEHFFVDTAAYLLKLPKEEQQEQLAQWETEKRRSLEATMAELLRSMDEKKQTETAQGLAEVSGWEMTVLGHAEAIRMELALVDGEIDPRYQRLFDACAEAAQHINHKGWGSSKAKNL